MKRISQLLARYIGVALIATASYVSGGDVSEETAATLTEYADVIAFGVVGVVALLGDLYLHRLGKDESK